MEGFGLLTVHPANERHGVLIVASSRPLLIGTGAILPDNLANSALTR